MQHFKTISDYCEGIQIDPPRHPHFDIRSFEENMPTVRYQMPAFRHAFYGIAIKADGDGRAITGQFTEFPEGATLFFNTPFQLLSWDIVPNWTGYYIMFSQDFVARSNVLTGILDLFPFLKIETSIPFRVPDAQLPEILAIYERIWHEYNGETSDKFQMIEAQVYLLLTYVNRLFHEQVDPDYANSTLKVADLKLLSRYKALIQTSFYPAAEVNAGSSLHSTNYYAQQLNVHPNHLNAVVKRITGMTALKHIHNHVLSLSKSRLVQTEWSVKEIAYSLHFDSPNNFSAFFKRNTDHTPIEYRNSKAAL